MDPTADQLIARLRANPADGAALAGLRAHYHRIGDFASLANLLEGFAAHESNASTAAKAFREAGDLVVQYLGDRARGAGLYERAVARDGHDEDAAERLFTLLEELGDFRKLAEALERRTAALEGPGGDPRAAAAVHQRLGELWQQRFQRPDRAIFHYRKAFEADATLVPAIYAAREIYREAGNLKAAASLYELESRAEPDPVRRLALLRELAHLRSENLGDLDGAISALSQALEQAPGDLNIMHELATTLLRRAEQSKSPDKALVDRRRAADTLYQMAQSVPAEHGLAYCESALDAVPDHDGALDMLERLADDQGRGDLLPLRWVGYLQAAPDAPAANARRGRLGHAYIAANQLDDAIICFEPLLEAGDGEAAETLVGLYRQVGREADVPHALAVSIRSLPTHERVPRLREMIQSLVAQGNDEEASRRAHEILEIDPSDAEALGFLEGRYRKLGDFQSLRELLVAASRATGLGPDARKLRLRDIADISENKLEDLEGAAGALRAITALDPADRDARTELARVLELANQWDELVQVLEREALTITDPEPKAELYFRLAHIHRDRRGDLGNAIAALESLRELRPGDARGRDELCDAFLASERPADAIPLLRERIDAASDKDGRVAMRRVLAGALEDLGDHESAFEASARLLDEEPGDIEALDRMERIDAQAGRHDRLLQTLSYRVEVTSPADQAVILRRMGELADQALQDLDGAAEYYQKALDLAPGDEDTLDRLVSVFDRAGRYKDLVVLLRKRANDEEEPGARAELYRRIARILGDRVRNEDAAREAWQQVLAAGEDEEALRTLRTIAAGRDEHEELSDLLPRIAVFAAPEEQRDLLMERARLLAGPLANPQVAVKALREVLDGIDPKHAPAMLELARLCEDLGDRAGLADALERRLALTEDPGLRVPLAQQLAGLYENELEDSARAIAALSVWADSDVMDPEPRRRLVVQLEGAERWEELVDALDALAGIESDELTAAELVLRAADVAQRKLADTDGAWARLAPRVRDGDDAAEEALRSLARDTGRGLALSEVYVSLAKTSDDPDVQHRRWCDASKVYDEFLEDVAKALEAMLRAFATRLGDRKTLEQVDRLAERADAWPRLAQVYETLLRGSDDALEKVELLLRHAQLLDERAEDPSEALNRVLRACSLVPNDDEVLARAEELAPRAGRADELLVVYDRRKLKAESDAPRLDAVLRAAKLCDGALLDRARAIGYVAQGVALSVLSPELEAPLEAAVRALDEARPELGANAALTQLIELYVHLAEDAEDDPHAGANLLIRASRILGDDLANEEAAYANLEKAASYAPDLEHVLDELSDFANATGRIESLDKHLDKLIDEALDSKTASGLLRRRGVLLEERLRRYEDAADVWRRLVTIASDDEDAPRRLRECLRRAGKHQRLLLVLDRELNKTDDPERELDILRAIATTWENDLKNRWEALDAWKKVLAAAPEDEEAQTAIERLGHSTRRLSTGEMMELEESSADILMPESRPGLEPLASDSLASDSLDDVVGLDTHEHGEDHTESALLSPNYDQAPDGAPVEVTGEAFADDTGAFGAVGFEADEVTDPGPLGGLGDEAIAPSFQRGGFANEEVTAPGDVAGGDASEVPALGSDDAPAFSSDEATDSGDCGGPFVGDAEGTAELDLLDAEIVEDELAADDEVSADHDLVMDDDLVEAIDTGEIMNVEDEDDDVMELSGLVELPDGEDGSHDFDDDDVLDADDDFIEELSPATRSSLPPPVPGADAPPARHSVPPPLPSPDRDRDD